MKLFDLRDKYKQSNQSILNSIDLIVLGCIVAHMFAPADPLDPFEYDILIKKCREDEVNISKHEVGLSEYNAKNKLKNVGPFCDQPEQQADQEPIQDSYYFQRQNQSDYFLLKNEFENCLKQFCSYERVGKLIDDLIRIYSPSGNHSNESASLVDEEFKIWICSLEKLTDKLMNTYYTYSDIVCLPANGLALLGYAMKGLYTSLKVAYGDHKNSSIIQLVDYLHTFPYQKNLIWRLAKKTKFSQAFKR